MFDGVIELVMGVVFHGNGGLRIADGMMFHTDDLWGKGNETSECAA